MYSSNDPYATDDIECQNISNNNYVTMHSQPTTNTKPNKPLSNTKTTKKKSNTSKILLIAFALILLGIIIGLAVHFGTRSTDTKNNHNSKELKFDFGVPSYCSVSSPTFSTGLDLAYTTSWKANSKKELGYGFVVVLYPNLKEKKLQAAVHIRGKVSAHADEIGLPGGHVDNGQETLVDGALRELKEEAMHKTAGLDNKHLQLIYGKKYQNHKKQDCISGLYVLFVNDTKALKGPSNKHKDEMKIDKTQGFDEPSRHKFVSWDIDATGKVSLSPNQQITSTVWTATLGSLKRVSDNVKCNFPQTTAAPTITTIAPQQIITTTSPPAPNPPASTAQVHPLISTTVAPSVTSTLKFDFSVPSYCSVSSPTFSTGLDLAYTTSWKANSGKELGYGFVVVVYPNLKEKKLQAAVHIRGKVSAHPGEIGLPGGHVDDAQETLVEGALRELQEEAMHKTDGLDKKHLQLIYGKKYQNHKKQGCISGLYVLFVNDTKALTGPSNTHKDEMKIDKKQGFDTPSRHKFVSWDIDATGKVSLSPNQQINSTVWTATLGSLRRVSNSVKCNFAQTAATTTTASPPAPNPPVNT